MQTLAEDNDPFHTNVIIEDDAEPEKVTYEYNFINIPWDDRSKNSKLGIVVFQVTILVTILAGVVNMFVLQYRGFDVKAVLQPPLNCRSVKIEDFLYVTRIHSAETQKLLCVAALVQKGVVLADHECIKDKKIVLRAGNPLSIECHNAFKLEFLQTYPNKGNAISMLKVEGHIEDCAAEISVGTSINKDVPFFSVGSPQQNGRALLWQPLILAPSDNCSKIDQSVKTGLSLCMKRFATCPLNPGDLLVQNDQLQGLALSKSFQSSNNSETVMSYFAKIDFIPELLQSVKKF